MTQTAAQLVESSPSLAPLADPQGERDAIRRRVSASVFDGVVAMISKLSYKHPGANPALYGVRVQRDLRYGLPGVPEHVLDVYMPAGNPGNPMPIVLYVHGGGFRLLSKASHWMMAVAFARRGYLVFNIDYRLAPRHAFPAALEDVNQAWLWILDNAHRFGGDTSRIVVAGESAGANLVSSLAIETSYDRSEPFAREVFARGIQPHAVMAACGIFQVSNVERLYQDRLLPGILTDWLVDMRDSYLGGSFDRTPPRLRLADPLLVLEEGLQPDRPLPPFFLPVGGLDILVDDTMRMTRALHQLDAKAEHRVYPGELHAFHMMPWRAATRRLWADTFTFLRNHLPSRSGARPAVDPLPVSGGSWVRDRIVSAMAA